MNKKIEKQNYGIPSVSRITEKKRPWRNGNKIRKSTQNINQPVGNSSRETIEKWEEEIFKEITQRTCVFIMTDW